MTMDLSRRQLEVPYNFDKNLITGLNILDPEQHHIHCIYSAPYRYDYKAAKYDYIHEGGMGVSIEETQTMSREDYESHMANIKEHFAGKMMLLLQRTADEDVMQTDMLKYYMSLGFTKFCVGSIAQAKLIKAINPFAEITASISMKLSVDELQNNKILRKYFNNVVLWFHYNRNLEDIEALPKCFKYILLVNCTCNIKCDGTHHWFADKAVEQSHFCPNRTSSVIWTTIYIRPTDVPIFANTISYLKLQGREYKTAQILEDYVTYTAPQLLDPYMPLDIELYKKKTPEERAELEMLSKQHINTCYKNMTTIDQYLPQRSQIMHW